MKLSWLNHGFICNELYVPFVLEKDIDYYEDLRKKYNLILLRAKKAGADEESLLIIDYYKKKILEAIRAYYKADIAKSNNMVL